jgi:hypothetical protein
MLCSVFHTLKTMLQIREQSTRIDECSGIRRVSRISRVSRVSRVRVGRVIRVSRNSIVSRIVGLAGLVCFCTI